MTPLDRIIGYKRWEVATRKRLLSERELRDRVGVVPRALDFAAALRRGSAPRVVAEFKRASPSKGAIRPGADCSQICCDYVEAGAVALSVLTDGRWFWGSLLDLWQAREQVAVPILRKDFVIDPYQIYEARAHGADAVLLLCAALDDNQLVDLATLARTLGMTVVIESHNRAEMERALRFDGAVIGLNNRNLKTMTVVPGVSEELRRSIPKDRVTLGESGVRTPEDVRRMANAGLDACLVGETLMSAEDPGKALRALLAG